MYFVGRSFSFWPLYWLYAAWSARKPIKTLLITGQNNHNWQVSHVVLKQILENSGRFSVDFAVSPEAGKDMSGFVLDFSPYELVVLDYNGDAWPEETNRRFLEYVRGGGGVVVYHAADNAFVNWRNTIRFVPWAVGRTGMRKRDPMYIGAMVS